MTPATLTPPPRASTEAGGEAPTPPRRKRADRRFRAALIGGLSASIAAHLVLFLLSPPLGRVALDPASPDPVISPSDRMVVVVPAPAADAAAPDPAREEVAPADRTPVDRDPRPAESPEEEEAAEPAPAAAPTRPNPLRPGAQDPRLRIDPRAAADEPGFVPTPHERYMRHLRARIDAVNDSTAAERERERRATDWTTTDSEGRRWGVSPDGIHLGPITLPPTEFRGYGGHDEAARERERRWREIRDQEEARERNDARREAAEETRRRRDRQRGDEGA